MKKMLFTFLSCFTVCVSLRGSELEKYISVCSSQGRRTDQEDQYRVDLTNKGNIGVAIFDGHGGEGVANLFRENFWISVNYELAEQPTVKEAFAEAIRYNESYLFTNDSYADIADEGSTLAALWLNTKENKGHIAYVGDSVAVLVGKDGTIYMSSPHRPTEQSELTRIEAAGGKVDGNGRVNGAIGVSRSIGDKFFKEKFPGLLISQPEYHEFDSNEYDYALLMTDGLYDAFNKTSEEARVKDFNAIFLDALLLTDEAFDNKHELTDVVLTASSSSSEHSEESSADLSQSSMNSVAQKLIRIARKRGSADNATVIVVNLAMSEVSDMSDADDVDGADENAQSTDKNCTHEEHDFNEQDVDQGLSALKALQFDSQTSTLGEPFKTTTEVLQEQQEEIKEVNVTDEQSDATPEDSEINLVNDTKQTIAETKVELNQDESKKELTVTNLTESTRLTTLPDKVTIQPTQNKTSSDKNSAAWSHLVMPVVGGLSILAVIIVIIRSHRGQEFLQSILAYCKKYSF